MLLQYVFADSPEGIYVWTRSDGKLLDIAKLRAKTKAYEVLIRDLLFVNDVSHSEEGLQHLVDKLNYAYQEPWD